MSRPADRLRAALPVVAAATLAVVLAIPAHAAPVPNGNEAWGAELALDGGDDSNLALTDGAVRLMGPAATGTPAVGVLMLAPRRTAGPVDTIAGMLTADRPPGTSVTADVRGLSDDGRWGPWVGIPADGAARLPAATTEIGVRLTLRGAPTGGAGGPVVRGLWLTSSHTGSASTTLPITPPATTTTPRTTTTTTPPATTTPPTTTPSTTTPSTTSPSTPGNPAVVWDADIAGRGLDGFTREPSDVTSGASVTVVPGPPRAVRFSVPGGSQRAEVLPQVPDLTEGQQRFFRLTYTLPSQFPVDADNFQLVTQWKNAGEGSPPVELRITEGKIAVSGGFGYPGGSRQFATDVAPVTGGRTIDVVVGILFSTDPAKGRIDVWLNGTERVAEYRPPGGTLYPGASSYWKVGLYRDTSLTSNATADLTFSRAGTTYQSVTRP